MALVNVAVELANRGRRVLAVDFDLEAPGLDTFHLLHPRDETSGMVDFVTAYLETGRAPEIRDYVYRASGIGDHEGGLWIMPSGAHYANYTNTLARIDWGSLYEHHDGYLLFEDLKEQWSASFGPDYVLIDSRTGHTDVGGICTRQLPNSVVVLFFPNAQNLRGLTKVIGDIRSERLGSRAKAIDLHFVMSNVPDLDDEDRILEESIMSFQRDLGFARAPLMVHRYDSLSLLNQVIFSKDRPRSRLAKEYAAITAGVMRLNPEDRDGALDYIKRLSVIRRSTDPHGLSMTHAVKHIERIESYHRNDGEVLFQLGTLRSDDGRFEDAVALFGRALKAGHRNPEVYLRRAHIRRWERNDHHGAGQDALDVLRSKDATSDQVRRAITLVAPERLKDVADSVAVAALPHAERAWIASELQGSKTEAETAYAILRPLLDSTAMDTDVREYARHELILSSIAIGRFSEALQIIVDHQSDLDRMSVYFAFNYGMALWGHTGEIEANPFHRVMEIEQAQPREDPTPNFLQCVGISSWAVGESNFAKKSVERSRQEIAVRGGQEFSCWRYLRVSATAFQQDLDEMLRLIDGDEAVTPRYQIADTPVATRFRE